MTRPARRRASKLAGQHPAYPPPAVETDTGEPPGPSPVTPERPRARDTDATSQRAQARARNTARSAGWAWAAARRRVDDRVSDWVNDLTRAREAGALPGVLQDLIRESAARAGIDPSEVPMAVWHATGYTPQKSGQ